MVQDLSYFEDLRDEVLHTVTGNELNEDILGSEYDGDLSKLDEKFLEDEYVEIKNYQMYNEFIKGLWWPATTFVKKDEFVEYVQGFVKGQCDIPDYVAIDWEATAQPMINDFETLNSTDLDYSDTYMTFV